MYVTSLLMPFIPHVFLNGKCNIPNLYPDRFPLRMPYSLIWKSGGSQHLFWIQLRKEKSVLYEETNSRLCIWGFRCEVDEICALLGYYATYSGNSLATAQPKGPNFKGEDFFTPEDRVDKLSRNAIISCAIYHSIKDLNSRLLISVVREFSPLE